MSGSSIVFCVVVVVPDVVYVLCDYCLVVSGLG